MPNQFVIHIDEDLISPLPFIYCSNWALYAYKLKLMLIEIDQIIMKTINKSSMLAYYTYPHLKLVKRCSAITADKLINHSLSIHPWDSRSIRVLMFHSVQMCKVLCGHRLYWKHAMCHEKWIVRKRVQSYSKLKYTIIYINIFHSNLY